MSKTNKPKPTPKPQPVRNVPAKKGHEITPPPPPPPPPPKKSK